jgi:hypothetical protein
MSDNNNWREEAAKVLKTVARDGLPEPRDLDVALDAIECAIDAQIASALKWRDAIDGLRTLRWNDPVRDHETPLRAVQRLLNSELTAMALNPAIHKAVKAEITQAKREALEEAARRLEELHKNHKYNPQTGEGSEHDTGYYRAIAEGVAHIRALKGEGDE